MNKNYFISLSVGLVLLLIITVTLSPSSDSNAVTGNAVDDAQTTQATTAPATTQSAAAQQAAEAARTAAQVPVVSATKSTAPIPVVAASTQFSPVVSTGASQQVGIDMNNDKVADVNFPNPTNVFGVSGTTSRIKSYNNGIVETTDGKFYRDIGTGVEELTRRTDGSFVPNGNRILESGGVITQVQNGRATFTAQNQQPIQVDGGLSSSLRPVLTNGKLTLQYGGKDAVISNNGNTISTSDASVSKVGSNYVTVAGGVATVSKTPDGKQPVSSIPTIKVDRVQGDIIFGKSGEMLVLDSAEGTGVYSKSASNGFVTETRVFETNGDVTTRKFDEETKALAFQRINHADGTRSEYQIKDGQPTTFSRYDKLGGFVQISDTTGKIYSIDYAGNAYDCGGCVLSTRTEVRNKGQFNEEVVTIVTDAKTGQEVTTKPLSQSQIPKDTLQKIQSNNFWRGKTKAAQFGQTLAEINSLYGKIQGNRYWLDKVGGLKDWKDQVDSFFAANYLGTAPIVSRICEVWIDKTDAPSSLARGKEGLPAAHIEGERVQSQTEEQAPRTSPKEVQTVLVPSYIYKVTFSVTPSYIATSSAKRVVFRAYLSGPSGERPVVTHISDTMKSNDNGLVELTGTSPEYSVTSSNMIVIETKDDYNTVCLDFSPSGGEISQRFYNDLRNGRLCNSLIQGNQP